MKTYSAFTKQFQENGQYTVETFYTTAKSKKEAVEKIRNAGHKVLKTSCKVVPVHITMIISSNPRATVID